MNATTVIDKKTLNLQYIIDESGNKTAAILAVDHLDKLLNQLADFAKRVEILSKSARQNEVQKSTSQEKEVSSVSPTETDNRLIEQQINLVTQHYDFTHKLLMELQRYLEIKTEVDRKLHYQRVLEQLKAELQECICKSRLILARSGYSTLMDLEKLEAKAFFIPTPGQTEQVYLAKHLKEQKIADYAEQNEFTYARLEGNREYTGFRYKKTPDKDFEASLFDVFK